MIKKIEVFETKGQQFRSFSKAVEYREGLIEEFLRKTPGFQNMPAKDRIKFVQHVIEQRDILKDLLDYSIDD